MCKSGIIHPSSQGLVLTLCINSKARWLSISASECPPAQVLFIEVALKYCATCLSFHSLNRCLQSSVGLEDLVILFFMKTWVCPASFLCSQQQGVARSCKLCIAVGPHTHGMFQDTGDPDILRYSCDSWGPYDHVTIPGLPSFSCALGHMTAWSCPISLSGTLSSTLGFPCHSDHCEHLHLHSQRAFRV